MSQLTASVHSRSSLYDEKQSVQMAETEKEREEGQEQEDRDAAAKEISAVNSPKEVSSVTINTAVNSPSTTSADRRSCRICQSETGVLVRPCLCAGTMGNVHDQCLSKWVNMSKKKACEICKIPYEKGGSKFKKLSEWEKPRLHKSNILDILLLVAIGYLIFYMMSLLYERKFFLKVPAKITLRPDDFGRLALLFFFLLCSSCILFDQLICCIHYLHRQREIHFVNRKRVAHQPAATNC